jgi:hypothetical protein
MRIFMRDHFSHKCFTAKHLRYMRPAKKFAQIAHNALFSQELNRLCCLCFLLFTPLHAASVSSVISCQNPLKAADSLHKACIKMHNAIGFDPT